MRRSINNAWAKASRIGLRDEEGVFNMREVIFLNRIVLCFILIMFVYMPVELYFNGPDLLPLVLCLMPLLGLALLFNKYRLFNLARYYSFTFGNLFIVIAGVMVGKGINNHVSLVPILLFGIILFKTRAERIMVLFIVIFFYILLQHLLNKYTPLMAVPDNVKGTFTFIFFILALVMNFFLGFYFIAINTEYEGIVIEQKAALSNKNKEITDSITYAKRIQKAILPPAGMIREALPDSFVLFRPKDIVAGDFYWLEKTRDLVLVAAADCTGHGVPGAMGSVICNNSLNRCVREFGLTEPAKILDKTREIIISEFEKSEEEIKDGMDISLCALNLKEFKMQWAGANNPLIIIRNNGLIEIKADKQPVGNYINARAFTGHNIQLEKGDLIYLFSDGYSDQFGGKEGKKLKYKSFKQLLLTLHHMPLTAQKERLEVFFNEWKGGIEQLDDVCVIGIRV